MSVTVADEGNKRHGGMSAEEVEQCLLDIHAWFDAAEAAEADGGKTGEGEGKASERGGPDGASAEDLEALSKSLRVAIPDGLQAMFRHSVGRVWFMEKQALSTDQVGKLVRDLEDNSHWREGLIPFASDVDGNLLVVDTRNGGCVSEWDADDGLGDLLSGSFVNFLEHFRNDLLSGRFEFVEDMGVLEKMGATAGSGK